MLMLIAGLALWITVHLFPSVAPDQKRRLIARIGDNAYRGLFSLVLISALILIIFGWRSTNPLPVYTPAASLHHPAMLLAAIALVLMVAASFPTRIKRVLRHPQLTGVLLWSIAHLVLNGDSRSVLVFACLCLWSAASMITINRRDGPWVKPVRRTGWLSEIVMLTVALVVVAIVVRFHAYLSGIPLI